MAQNHLKSPRLEKYALFGRAYAAVAKAPAAFLTPLSPSIAFDEYMRRAEARRKTSYHKAIL